MFLQYVNFYRQFGIRRPQQLLAPLVFTADILRFSRNSLFHYVSYDGAALDPDSNSVYLSGYNKRILIDYVLNLTSTESNPRHRQLSILQLIKPFLSKHKEFKYVKEPYVKVKDPYSLIVINHAYINKVYKYVNVPMTHYYAWLNTEKTLWNKVVEIAKESDREQYIFYEMPDVLPSVSSLKLFTIKTNKSILKLFDTPGKLFILEMWKWLDAKHRESSIFNTLPVETLDKINLVLMHNGKWIILNLKYLDQWRADPAKEKIPNVPQYSPIIIQKLFLKAIMQLNSLSHPLAEDVLDTEAEVNNPEERAVSDDGLNTEDTDTDEEENTSNAVLSISKPTISKSSKDTGGTSKQSIASALKDDSVNDDFLKLASINDMSEILKALDKDLEDLEYMEKKNLEAKKIHIDAEGEEKQVVAEVKIEKTSDEILMEINTPTSPTDKLKKQLDEYASYGIMSASDYRSAAKAIEKFNTIKDPFNNTELLKDIVVTADNISIPKENTVILNSTSIEDKSMQDSSLKVFDKKYINEVMHKDISMMVTSMQSAGVIIEEYAIEKDKTVLGEFEYHEIKMRPVSGKTSTVRFKLPVVNEDGTFLSNGNKYSMRKQRTD